MNCWLDCIQIWNGYSLGIVNDLINFWDEFIKDESIKNKMAVAAIKKNWHGQMDRAYGWGVLPSIDGYFLRWNENWKLSFLCNKRFPN